MCPFRDAPPVELGSIDVGLEDAVARAIDALPRGGRLIVPRVPRFASHLAGALGSTGLFGVFVATSTAWASRWSPRTISEIALCLAGVILGGSSLALVMHALDQSARPPTRSGVEVRRAARRILDRLAAIAAHARSADDFAERHAVRLRRALADAEASDLSEWIPADVRGRAHLLLARVLAARGGPAWIADAGRRARVLALLGASAEMLDDPTPAQRDLATLDAAPTGLRIRVDPVTVDGDDDELDEATRAVPALIHRP